MIVPPPFSLRFFCIVGLFVGCVFSIPSGISEISDIYEPYGFNITLGVNTTNYLPITVSVGDINNDSLSDLLYFQRTNSYSNVTILLLLGDIDYSSVLVSNPLALLNSPNVPRIRESVNYLGFGYGRISGRGDINNDGIDDFAFATDWSPQKNIYIFFGRETWPYLQYEYDADVIILQPSASVGWYALSWVGDVNNDGFDDLGLGCSQCDIGFSNSGTVYILFGSASLSASINPSTYFNGVNGAKYHGPQSSSLIGLTISSAGDFNNDGFDDILLGSYRISCSAGSYCGAAYIIYGKSSGWPSSYSLLSGTTSMTGITRVYSSDASRNFGYIVSGGGDINNDGIDDILVVERYGRSSSNISDNSGRGYIFFGDGTTPSNIVAQNYVSDGNFIVVGNPYTRLDFGAIIGDFDNDGYDDFVVSGYSINSDSLSSCGAAFLIFGANETTFQSYTNSSLIAAKLNGVDGFSIYGSYSNAKIGLAVNQAGDWNQDGFADFHIQPLSSYTLSQVVYGNSSCPPSHYLISNRSCSACPTPTTTGYWNHQPTSFENCTFAPYPQNPFCSLQEYINIVENIPICTPCPAPSFSINQLGGFNTDGKNRLHCEYIYSENVLCPANHYIDTVPVQYPPYPTEHICVPCDDHDSMVNPVASLSTECKKFTCPSGQIVVFSDENTQVSCQDNPLIPIGVSLASIGAISSFCLFRYRQSSKKLKIVYRDIDVSSSLQSGTLALGAGSTSSKHNINILSLDGGGIRGLVTVGILEYLEDLFSIPIRDAFHLIGGTSTGGLIALSMGDPNLNLIQVRSLYEQLGSKVFQPQWGLTKLFKHLVGTTLYSSERFTNILTNIFGMRPLYNESERKFPFTLSIATLTSVNPPCEFLFRNFINEKSRYLGSTVDEEWPVWEAARCTSAAPIFFSEHCRQSPLDNRLWSDGALFHNNPSRLVYREALQLFPNASFGVFVSVGTGKMFAEGSENKKSSVGWIKTMTGILTNSERVHSEMNDAITDGSYFRFNISLPKQIPIDAASKDDIQILNLLTQAYTCSPKNYPLFEQCQTRFLSTYNHLKPPLQGILDKKFTEMDSVINMQFLATKTPEFQISQLRDQITQLQKSIANTKASVKQLQGSFSEATDYYQSLKDEEQLLSDQLDEIRNPPSLFASLKKPKKPSGPKPKVPRAPKPVSSSSRSKNKKPKHTDVEMHISQSKPVQSFRSVKSQSKKTPGALKSKKIVSSTVSSFQDDVPSSSGLSSRVSKQSLASYDRNQSQSPLGLARPTGPKPKSKLKSVQNNPNSSLSVTSSSAVNLPKPRPPLVAKPLKSIPSSSQPSLKRIPSASKPLKSIPSSSQPSLKRIPSASKPLKSTPSSSQPSLKRIPSASKPLKSGPSSSPPSLKRIPSASKPLKSIPSSSPPSLKRIPSASKPLKSTPSSSQPSLKRIPSASKPLKSVPSSSKPSLKRIPSASKPSSVSLRPKKPQNPSSPNVPRSGSLRTKKGNNL